MIDDVLDDTVSGFAVGVSAPSGSGTTRNRFTVNRAATKIGEGTARSVCTWRWGRKEAQ
jgi:hypothetical protein